MNTRFVSNTKDKSRVGSIHREVPVNPVWPRLSAEKNRPLDDPSVEGVSNPNALVLAVEKPALMEKVLMQSRLKKPFTDFRLRRISPATAQTPPAVPNRPA